MKYLTTQYPNSVANAEEYANCSGLKAEYKAKEIEVFLGDRPIDSTYHYRNDRWFSINLENIGEEPVIQILIDNEWVFIQVKNEVLLDRIGEFEFPSTPNEKDFVILLARSL